MPPEFFDNRKTLIALLVQYQSFKPELFHEPGDLGSGSDISAVDDENGRS